MTGSISDSQHSTLITLSYAISLRTIQIHYSSMYVVFNYCLRFCIHIIVCAFIMFELLQNLGSRVAERLPGHGHHRHPGDLLKEIASVGNSMECRERPPKLVDVHTSAARFGTIVTSIDWPAGQPNSYVTTRPFQWTSSIRFSMVV